MAPTDVGLASSQLPSKGSIQKSFQDAVLSGSDVSLGGLIPISVEQREQLAAMKGWTVFREDASGEYGVESLWLDKKRTSAVDITIHFDGAGRPIGLWLRTSPIRTTVVTSAH